MEKYYCWKSVFYHCLYCSIKFFVYNIYKAPIRDFFKNISYDVYLCQGISFLVVSLLPMDNKYGNTTVVFLLTYFLAYICKNIRRFINIYFCNQNIRKGNV